MSSITELTRVMKSANVVSYLKKEKKCTWAVIKSDASYFYQNILYWSTLWAEEKATNFSSILVVSNRPNERKAHFSSNWTKTTLSTFLLRAHEISNLQASPWVMNFHHLPTVSACKDCWRISEHTGLMISCCRAKYMQTTDVWGNCTLFFRFSNMTHTFAGN